MRAWLHQLLRPDHLVVDVWDFENSGRRTDVCLTCNPGALMADPDPLDAYIERGAGGLDFCLQDADLPAFAALLKHSETEQRMRVLRSLAEAVLEASGALEAIARLDGLDR